MDGPREHRCARRRPCASDLDRRQHPRPAAAHNWRTGIGAARSAAVPGRDRACAAKRTVEAEIVDFDKELDARGLSCPLPILKTKKSLNELTSGQVLKVVATDPGSVKDMQAFANQTGNPLLSSAEENKTYVFYLKKK
jgi:tRNA 2-thiouridine synthesizing protein A